MLGIGLLIDLTTGIAARHPPPEITKIWAFNCGGKGNSVTMKHAYNKSAYIIGNYASFWY